MKILIVDDERNSRKLLRAQLEAEGQTVVEASDGVEALTALASDSVDGVISDLLMPNLDGYRLCAEVRRNPGTAWLPFLVYTATFTSLSDERFAQEAGADSYFKKPAKPGVLLAALELIASKGKDRKTALADRGAELQFIKSYSELLVRKLEEKHRSLQTQTEALRRSLDRNRLLAGIVNSSEDAIIGSSPDGTVLSWNGGAARLYGYSPDEAVGKSISMLIPPDRDQEYQSLMCQVARGEATASLETMHVRKDGSLLDVSVRLSSIRSELGETYGIAAIARDISGEKRMWRKLQASEIELRFLAARLETIRENEAIRIARQVHDELGQSLTALNMDLVWVEKKMTATFEGTHRGELLDRIKSMSELIASTTLAVQRISSELRPGVLDDLGLTAALEWYAEEFEKRSGIVCHWKEKSELPDLPAATATALFRIFQEVLTNVCRHSGAMDVTLALRPESNEVVLEVEDNGKGFAVEQFIDSKSLGLLGMRERALLMGGKVEIKSVIGSGTCVRIHVPFKKPE